MVSTITRSSSATQDFQAPSGGTVVDSAKSGPEAIRAAIPQEVVNQVHDAAVALLVALYILHIGQVVGEEMAGTVGFPIFPTERTARLDLMRDLGHYLDVRWTIDFVEALERRLRPPTLEASIPAEDTTAEEKLLAAAIFNSGERTEPQARILSKTLSEIASTLVLPRHDLRDWEPGLRGVTRITRLLIEAVPPTKIGTMAQLRNQGSGLRVIATLGGALFLGSSIRVLADNDQATPGSRYAQLGLRLAALTQHSGGRVHVSNSEEIALFKNGLREFALRGGSTFAIEHPFHFRVLLEVLSDENRRYPAEPVLNVEAMRHIWPNDSLWLNFVWSRDQLPVVVNLIRSPESQRADAFIQHYAAFGRTPHTSSFTHLDYEIRSPVGGGPALASWPTAFAGYRDRPVQNMPNSVCEVIHAIEQQRRLGRVWRGAAEENDLTWLCGQLVAWDEHREPDGTVAARIWRCSSWLGSTFPVAAMSEIRTGAWILEALRLRLAAAASPESAGTEDQEHLDQERRTTEELRCVLEIMVLFSTDYLSGTEDGIPGLTKTLDQLRSRDWFTEMGPQLNRKLNYLEISLNAFGEKLGDEVAAAVEALAGLRNS
jgi:hypothetical protein